MNSKIRVFLVDDEPLFLTLAVKALPSARFAVEVFSGAAELLDVYKRKEFDVGVIDLSMPGMDGMTLLKELRRQEQLTEIIMLTGQASVPTAIEAIKLGCYDYMTKPVKFDDLQKIIEKACEKKALNRENLILKKELQLKDYFHELVGRSENMRQVFSLIEKVARTNSPVLITGESGTGKELVAKAIHKSSLRSEKPFIVIDCAALSETLLENELFGHEEGAFTDAGSLKRGLFEVADGGTLFIDEIGEMKLSTQAKLLRVTETQQFRRLGGNRQIQVDVRIVAATNRNLSEEVKKGTFRNDLFYRLNVVPVHMPALRDRPGDIPLLANYFLANNRVTSARKKISPEAERSLLSYAWPGNVRELSNTIERALIVSGGESIIPADLPVGVAPSPAPEQVPSLPSAEGKSLDRLIEEFTRAAIQDALIKCNGNRVEAARRLQLTRSKLYRLMEKLDIH